MFAVLKTEGVMIPTSRRGLTEFLMGLWAFYLVFAVEAVANDVWPRPEIVPIPVRTQGVTNPVLSLNGIWEFTLSPPPEFWLNSVDPSSWADVNVPGELVTQGFNISRDVEYPYKRSVVIPRDFSGKRIILRCDGIYSYARVWVNGKLVRDHHGGFTSWDADVTSYVVPGQSAWITVGVTDKAEEISYGSNYAKHYIGGILRDVKLIALPGDHATRLQVETDLDASSADAQLSVTAAVALRAGHQATIDLRLRDPQNNPVPLNPRVLTLTRARPEVNVMIPITAPRKWDAEHPNLYTLEAVVAVDGSEVETLVRRVGFRKVERRGNKLYVNGTEVKLRGVCRHDIHPLRGRSTTPELDERDVLLLREANVNFVRTSHYPPTEKFLEACDRYGMYVEEETAVCFVLQESTGSSVASQDAPGFTSRYMHQFAEMIERDRSHPSVIIWSLGNESRWGPNFAQEYAYAKREDPTRPVIFSYPNTVPEGAAGYDIWSKHYPKFDGDLKSSKFPKLNDENAHVACYNTSTLKRDSGVRNFWGESLKRFWENCFSAEGCLGGAIWGAIDEVFLLPDAPVGYGEWGILDGWRRPKPEYWLTKKAYSPIRITDEPVANPGAGQSLAIPIQNWFDHTDLNEISVTWSAGADSGGVTGLNLAPHAQGTLTIPARPWRQGEVLNLKFHRAGGILVDEYNLVVGRPRKVFPGVQGPAPQVTADSNTITVSGSDFSIVFSKGTGLITQGAYQGKTILEGGPYLNLGGVSLASWWLTSVSHAATPDEVVINLRGIYMALRGKADQVSVEFEIRIDGKGLISTTYRIADLPKGVSEVGVAYVLSGAVDRLTWERKGLWSAYPADHIGRCSGTARKTSRREMAGYRAEPTGAWADDGRNYFLFGGGDEGGRGTNDFRSLKENIWYASCVLAGENVRLRAESEGAAAVRAEVRSDGKVIFNIDNLWDYPDLDWGNYEKPIAPSPGYSNKVRMRLTDNDNLGVTYEDVSTNR